MMKKLIKAFLVGLIKIYQLSLSRILPSSCRFVPSCSEYAIQAISTHGAIKGIYLSSIRILKCNPFFPPGKDSVPLEDKD